MEAGRWARCRRSPDLRGSRQRGGRFNSLVFSVSEGWCRAQATGRPSARRTGGCARVPTAHDLKPIPHHDQHPAPILHCAPLDHEHDLRVYRAQLRLMEKNEEHARVAHRAEPFYLSVEINNRPSACASAQRSGSLSPCRGVPRMSRTSCPRSRSAATVQRGTFSSTTTHIRLTARPPPQG